MQVASYESPKATRTFVELKLESEFAKKQKELLKFVAQQGLDLLSKKEIIKVLGQCKNSPNGPFTSVEELNNPFTSVEELNNPFTSVEELNNLFTSVEELNNLFTSVEELNNPFTSVEELNNPFTGVEELNNLFTSVEELNNPFKKCTLLQQKNTTVENRVRSLTSLTSSQLGLSASAEIDDLEVSMCQCLSMNSENQHQPSLYEQQ